MFWVGGSRRNLEFFGQVLFFPGCQEPRRDNNSLHSDDKHKSEEEILDTFRSITFLK